MTNTGTGASTVKSSSSYWTTRYVSNASVLFVGEIKNIINVGAEDRLYNQKNGSTDYLVVTGSAGSYTFKCPNTTSYISADTDNVWFDWNFVQRTVTEAELIGYDLSGTPVKYLDAAPNSIEGIVILSSALAGTERDNLFKDLHLSIYWDGTPNAYGRLKSNRGLARSVFTPTANPITADGHSKSWISPLSTNGRVVESGADSIYWDKLIPYGTLGAVLNSGALTIYSVYKIVTTQANYFFAGCAVGDTFVANNVNGLSANNSVRKYTGNHLAQFTAGSRPVDQVFNGTSHFMRCPTFSYAQPEFIYLVVKQISWTNTDYILDGVNQNTGMLQQSSTTPKIRGYAGSAGPDNANLTVGSIGVIRLLFEGANSKLIVDGTAPSTGNFGASNMGGVTLGGNGAGASGTFSNIQFYEAIFRDSADSEADIYTYLRNKVDLGLY